MNYACVLASITCGGDVNGFVMSSTIVTRCICGIKVVVAAQLVAEGERRVGSSKNRKSPPGI
ncbi:MAG: hypothetical protein ACLTSG_10510 [Lachnospiraceae bacterium]